MTADTPGIGSIYFSYCKKTRLMRVGFLPGARFDRTGVAGFLFGHFRGVPADRDAAQWYFSIWAHKPGKAIFPANRVLLAEVTRYIRDRSGFRVRKFFHPNVPHKPHLPDWPPLVERSVAGIAAENAARFRSHPSVS